MQDLCCIRYRCGKYSVLCIGSTKKMHIQTKEHHKENAYANKGTQQGRQYREEASTEISDLRIHGAYQKNPAEQGKH